MTGLTTCTFHLNHSAYTFIIKNFPHSLIQIINCFALSYLELHTVLISTFLLFHCKTDYWYFLGLLLGTTPIQPNQERKAFLLTFYCSAEPRPELFCDISSAMTLLWVSNLFISVSLLSMRTTIHKYPCFVCAELFSPCLSCVVSTSTLRYSFCFYSEY